MGDAMWIGGLAGGARRPETAGRAYLQRLGGSVREDLGWPTRDAEGGAGGSRGARGGQPAVVLKYDMSVRNLLGIC